MRARPWLIASAGLNLALAFAWLTAGKSAPSFLNIPDTTNSTPQNASNPKTMVVVRRQHFSWKEVESEDYATYIKNLRDIGCPESTIRDLIVADVNQLYARRQVAEVVSPDSQWWRSEPDLHLVEDAVRKVKELDAERRALLTKLLGPGWENQNDPLPPLVRAGISLTGPVLGEMPALTKQAVYDLMQGMQHRQDAYLDAQRQQNKPVDPAELARIESELRGDLAKILSPEQLEEFLLRYSHTAQQIREELRGLELKPDEFRALFRVRDPLDTRPEVAYGGDDPDALKRRQEIDEQREKAMKELLGPERFTAYKLNQDPLYRESRELTQVLGLPAAKIMPIYEINRLTQAELDEIRMDPNLTNEEKVEALAAARVEQQKSLEKILGAQAFALWLSQNAR